MPFDLKPFLFETKVALDKKFTLHLAIDVAFIDKLETLLGRGMEEIIGDAMSSASTMTKLMWSATRKHHSDLTMDQVAGIQYSPKHGPKVMTALGDLVRKAFNVSESADG
jgi:hypothetical protein